MKSFEKWQADESLKAYTARLRARRESDERDAKAESATRHAMSFAAQTRSDYDRWKARQEAEARYGAVSEGEGESSKSGRNER